MNEKKISLAMDKIEEILNELKNDGVVGSVETTDVGDIDYSKKRPEKATAIIYPATLTENSERTLRKNIRFWNIDIALLWKTGKGKSLGKHTYVNTVESILNKFDDKFTLDDVATMSKPASAPPMVVEGNEDYVIAFVSLNIGISRQVAGA